MAPGQVAAKSYLKMSLREALAQHAVRLRMWRHEVCAHQTKEVQQQSAARVRQTARGRLSLIHI
eukprot:7242398-Alexandrium_andersonii.AAC.1